MLGEDDTERLGGWDAVRAAGVENLRREPLESEHPVSEGTAHFTFVEGESVHTASHAVLLPQLAGAPDTADGWLLAVPSRHQLLWHVVRDRTVVASLAAMARIALRAYEASPGALSPDLYWWDGTAYERVTSLDGGTIAVDGTGSFGDVVNRIVGGG